MTITSFNDSSVHRTKLLWLLVLGVLFFAWDYVDGTSASWVGIISRNKKQANLTELQHPATRNVTKNQSMHYVLNSSSYKDTNVSTITEEQQASRCCYNAEDPNQRYTPAFFQEFFPAQAQNMYKQWMALSHRYFDDMNSTTTGNTVINTPSASKSCEAGWMKTVFHEIEGHYIPHYMTSLRPQQIECPWFRFVPEPQRKPRILLLGDSLSMGIWVSTQDLFQNSKGSVASIHGAPCNCMGIEKYQTGLQHWLGDCEWDLIQFNIGMHHHGQQLKPYQEGLANITARMREHSPNAHVVFALTTPSPFDSNETVPNRTSCANYNRFHKAGVVASLNEAAISTLQKQLNVTINDRYHAILPQLGHYQKPCDVHLIKAGYEFLARHDWNLLTSLLSS